MNPLLPFVAFDQSIYHNNRKKTKTELSFCVGKIPLGGTQGGNPSP